MGRLEEAFHKICAVEDLEKKVMKAVKDNVLMTLTFREQIAEALQCNLLNPVEAKQLDEAELARQGVIKVDDFSDDELRRSSPVNKHKTRTIIPAEKNLETGVI
jgi:acyl-CoA dehydrogenase